MLNRFSEKIICGLDIGSQRIKASMVRSREFQNQELLGIYEAKASGFKEGSVTDLGELTECIHSTIDELMKKTGLRVREVQLGISGDLIETRRNSSAVPLVDRGNKIITNTDIKKVNHQACLLGMKIDEEIVHDLPQSYQVDDVNSALNPVGLYGRKLSVETLLIVANRTRIRNLIAAVRQAGFNVADIYFSSCAAAEVVLSDKEREEGCILVDIGCHGTNLLIYKNNILRYVERIPLAGAAVTQRIAQELGLAFDFAEEIKKTYAVAVKADKRNEEEILVKRDSQYVPIRREAIWQAMEPEINQLVQSIRQSIQSSGWFDQLNKGIVMVGGGSLLPGLLERIEEIMNMPVDLGKMNIPNTNVAQATVYASVVGLTKAGLNKLWGPILSREAHRGFKQQVAYRLKEFYQEYF